MLIVESILLKESFNFLKTIAVFTCIIGIILTIQPWNNQKSNSTESDALLPQLSNHSLEIPHRERLTISPINNTDVRNDCMEGEEGKNHGHEYNTLYGYICIAINILTTVAILIYHKNKLTDLNAFVLLFWAFIIGTPVSALAMFAIEHSHLSVHWTMKTILLVLGHGFGASMLTLFTVLANQLTSSLIVQLTSSLHLILLLVGQYTVLMEINPGHHNAMEVAGICIVFVGSCLIPVLSTRFSISATQ